MPKVAYHGRQWRSQPIRARDSNVELVASAGNIARAKSRVFIFAPDWSKRHHLRSDWLD